MDRKRLLLVSKRPPYDLLTVADRRRLAEAGAIDPDRLLAGKESHHETLGIIENVVKDHKVLLTHLDEVGPAHVRSRDLVIAIGGDGTALSAHYLLKQTPLLAVNSDPGRSIGHYTRCTGDSFAALFERWLADEHQTEVLARLELQFRGRSRKILNECLICNANPGTMSRYRLVTPDGEEEQRSSGIWVSTASGSTGAIASAGMQPVDTDTPALLFRVREPFLGQGPLTLLEGVQRPPQSISVTAGMTGLAAHIDGHPGAIEIAPGSSVTVTGTDDPLHLISG